MPGNSQEIDPSMQRTHQSSKDSTSSSSTSSSSSSGIDKGNSQVSYDNQSFENDDSKDIEGNIKEGALSGSTFVAHANSSIENTFSENQLVYLEKLKDTEMSALNMHGQLTPSPRPSVINEESLTEYRNLHQSRNISFSQKAAIYLKSQRGRELTLSMSVGCALLTVVFFFALLMSRTFNDSLGDTTLEYFICIVYGLSIIYLVILMILGCYDRLSTNTHHIHQDTTSFIRAGMIGLGTGGILYRSLHIMAYFASEENCKNELYLFGSILGVTFTLLQMAFLMKYSKIEINKSFGLSIAARFMMMQIIATNLCLWLYIIVEETVHELSHSSDDTTTNHSEITSYHGYHSLSSEQDVNFFATTGSNCEIQSTIQNLLAPYLFALLVEFCIVSSTMIIAIWEKAGLGTDTNKKELQILEMISNRTRNMSIDSQSTITATNLSNTQQENLDNQTRALTTSNEHVKYNSYGGFMAGWIVVCGAAVVSVFSLYSVYTDADYITNVDEIVYGSSFAVVFLCVIVIPITTYRMSELTFKDNEIRHQIKPQHAYTLVHGLLVHSNVHKNLDKQLMNITFVSLMFYRAFCILASINIDWTTGESPADEIILLIDSVFAIIMAGLQTMLCNWYAAAKRSTLEEHLEEKPGKQGLEFLRLSNFALWFLNSFLLKNPEAKYDQIEIFGETSWAILSNIFHPLAILYYFHSFICIAEILHRSYSRKYIGVVRGNKVKRGMASRRPSLPKL